ncbi:MAG TPA: class I SAM-dependent methyltransferase [bacterium]|nr:class I SAM-dependent methyltransferase [bacterium]
MKSLDCGALYENAKWYDLQHRDYTEDLPMYRSLANQYGGPVLELACGTGRITLVLASDGHSVCGLDVSEPMLTLARKKASKHRDDVRFFQGDVRDFNLGRKFGLILFPFNSISHLHDQESIEGMFACVRKHLQKEGRFIISMFIPNPGYLVRDPSQRYPVSTFTDPDCGDIVITESNTYDPVRQINHITWFYRIAGSDHEIMIQNNMRMFFPQEFRSLLHYNGFRVETVFGGYDMRPQNKTSPMQIYMCRRV